MSNAGKVAGTPNRDKIVRSAREGSRRDLLDGLAVGDSLVFICEPGDGPGPMQRAISGTFRGGESMSQQGLEQQKGLLVFEGEPALSVTRVTRISEPRK